MREDFLFFSFFFSNANLRVSELTGYITGKWGNKKQKKQKKGKRLAECSPECWGTLLNVN